MAGRQYFSPGDIQFQLVMNRGQCAESSYLNIIFAFRNSYVQFCFVLLLFMLAKEQCCLHEYIDVVFSNRFLSDGSTIVAALTYFTNTYQTLRFPILKTP